MRRDIRMVTDETDRVIYHITRVKRPHVIYTFLIDYATRNNVYSMLYRLNKTENYAVGLKRKTIESRVLI